MPNEEKKVANIQRTIEAGIDKILSSGVRGIKMQTIGEDAGVSSRSVARYFRTKENFVETVLKQMCMDDLEEARVYWKDRNIDELTGLEQVRIFFESLMSVYKGRSERIMAVIEAELYLKDAENSTRAAQRIASNSEAFIRTMNGFLRKGEEDGSIRKLDEGINLYTDMLAQSFWGLLMQMAVVNRIEMRSEEQCMETVKCFVNTVLRDLAARSS